MRHLVALIFVVCGSTATGQADPAADFNPLIKRAVDGFLEVARTGDTSEFAQYLADNVSPDEIEQSAQNLRNVASELAPALAELAPVITASELQAGVRLNLIGYYPTYPSRSFFDLSFAWQQESWRIKGLSIQLRPLIEHRTFRHNAGWSISFQPLIRLRDIQYAMSLDGEYQSLGLSQYIDPDTGLQKPNTNISLQDLPERIFVRMTGMNHESVGPFEMQFNGRKIVAAGAIQALKMTPGGWALLRTHMGRELLYFTALISNRCGIEKVLYSLGSEALDQTFELPPCDLDNPHAIPRDAVSYFEVDQRYDYIAVRLKLSDGSTTNIVKVPHS